MIVYHGSYTEVQHPDICYSENYLDFAKGFYVTSVKIQAERWAKRKGVICGNKKGIVSSYEMITKNNFKIKDFLDDFEIWIDFVCKCRDGSDLYTKYDVIKGKVANDKVFRVVDMYRRGIWDKTRAIKEIKIYETYDQIAFISQNAIDSMLSFLGSYEVTI